MKKQVLFLVLCCMTLGITCTTADDIKDRSNETKLAQVYNKTLYLSDLEDMIPENASPQDSALILNALVERWAREMVIMHEAEKNISKDLNIDKLVRDYRASLIKHNYEKLLVEIELDSTISASELNDYYEKNKDQYQLESTILRCHFIKIPLNTPNMKEVKFWWNNNNEENYKKLLEHCVTFAEVYMLEDSTWYKVDDISSQLPKGTLTPYNVNSKKEIILKDNNYQYFLHIFETISKKEIAPLAFIEDQATKVILHDRKLKLLEDKKLEIYERESRRNNVKFYTQ